MTASYQLYSSRNEPSWSEVLSNLADLGYTQVEGFGGVYADPESFRALLDQTGLSMPSGHFAVSALEDDYDGCVHIAKTLGIRQIFAPYLSAEERPVDKAGWLDFAARLAVIGEKLRSDGFRFGWHNHDFEFQPLADGTVPMRILLEADSKLEWEADLAWVIRGGDDPSLWIAEFGDRISAVHVKDIAPEGQNQDEDGWSDVGAGTVNWRDMVPTLRAAGVTLFILEHDNPSDGARFAATSIASFGSY